MPEALDDAQLAGIESHAIELARGAGAILSQHFGELLEVEFKDASKSDPVTEVDKECQRFLATSIADEYPDHGFIGEEEEVLEGKTAPDVVRVVEEAIDRAPRGSASDAVIVADDVEVPGDGERTAGADDKREWHGDAPHRPQVAAPEVGGPDHLLG